MLLVSINMSTLFEGSTLEASSFEAFFASETGDVKDKSAIPSFKFFDYLFPVFLPGKFYVVFCTAVK